MCRKLLEGTDLTLARTLEIAAQCESVELQMAALHVSPDSEIKEMVSLVSKKGARDQKKRMQYSKGGTYSDKTCYRCGQTGHFAKDFKCPARGKSCRRCNGKDHFAKMCKTKDRSKQTIKRVDSGEKNQ